MKKKNSFDYNGIYGNNSDIDLPIQIGIYDDNGDNSENNEKENYLNMEKEKNDQIV